MYTVTPPVYCGFTATHWTLLESLKWKDSDHMTEAPQLAFFNMEQWFYSKSKNLSDNPKNLKHSANFQC